MNKLLRTLALTTALLCAFGGLAATLAEADGEARAWYARIIEDKDLAIQYPYHAFVDVNGDGDPALLISTTPEYFIGSEDSCLLYLCDDGSPRQVMELGGKGGEIFYCNPAERALTYYYRYSGEGHIEVYHVTGGTLELVTTADSYSPHHHPETDNQEMIYLQDGAPISEAEADALWNRYTLDEYIVSYVPMEQ